MIHMMKYFAISRAEGNTPLQQVLSKDELLWSHNSTLVIITSSSQSEWVTAIRELSKRGIQITTILVDGRSFGGFINTLDTIEPLCLVGIPAYVVSKGDDINTSLSQTYKTNTGIRRSRFTDVTAGL